MSVKSADIIPSKDEPSLLTRFLVCLFYGATSGSLSLLMKALLSGYKFNGFFLMLSAQMGLQLFACYVTREFMGNPFGVTSYDRGTHMASLKMGLTGVGNVVCGLVGLQLVNIPMFLCIRRLVSPFILFYEFVILGKMASMGVNSAVALILLGTLVAGYETLSGELFGYFIVILNNILSAGTSVMQKQVSGLLCYVYPQLLLFRPLYLTRLFFFSRAPT